MNEDSNDENNYDENNYDNNFLLSSMGNLKNKNTPFNSLIAYNSKKTEFEINNDIDELTEDLQNIIKSTINILNENIKKEKYFKCDLYIILHFIFDFFTLLIFTHLSMVIFVMLLFNPMIIILIILGYIKLVFILIHLHKLKRQKNIMKNVKYLLKEENQQEMNIRKNIKWKFGRGNWIEVNIQKPTRKI